MYVHVQHIGQANQKTVLSTPSMSMLLQGGFTACTPGKFLKLYASLRLNLRAFQTYYYIAIGAILILTVHILAIAICSFIIISTSVAIATVLHLLTQTIDCIDSVTGYEVYIIYAQATH